MGAAAYNRGSRLLARDVEERIKDSRVTTDSLALFYRDLLQQGCILHFRRDRNTSVVAGPAQYAVPGSGAPFELVRYGRTMQHSSGSAWGTAAAIIREVGKKRPHRVSCGGSLIFDD